MGNGFRGWAEGRRGMGEEVKDRLQSRELLSRILWTPPGLRGRLKEWLKNVKEYSH